tara:strand:+ start:827 stop:1012 length:186 start_codon:yes stop_codon:yes gene_type:complete
MKNLTVVIGLTVLTVLTSCSTTKEAATSSTRVQERQEKQEYVVVHIKDSKEFFLLPKVKNN